MRIIASFIGLFFFICANAQDSPCGANEKEETSALLSSGHYAASVNNLIRWKEHNCPRKFSEILIPEAIVRNTGAAAAQMNATPEQALEFAMAVLRKGPQEECMHAKCPIPSESFFLIEGMGYEKMSSMLQLKNDKGFHSAIQLSLSAFSRAKANDLYPTEENIYALSRYICALKMSGLSADAADQIDRIMKLRPTLMGSPDAFELNGCSPRRSG